MECDGTMILITGWRTRIERNDPMALTMAPGEKYNVVFVMIPPTTSTRVGERGGGVAIDARLS